MSYYKNTKKRIMFCLMAITIGFSSVMFGAYKLKPMVAAAEDGIISTGYIPAETTAVNIRRSPDTSDDSNVIACVNGVFNLDIYGIEYTSSNYAWYSVGFYLNQSYHRGYIAAELVTVNSDGSGGDGGYTEDSDFEAYMNSQGFPESYKEGLRQLHAQYPKWTFVAEHLDTDWNTMVQNQNVTGRSLINNIEPDSWKSTAPGCYDWTTGTYTDLDGGWVQASEDLIKYALDPRNFLNTTNIFMFESLSYNTSFQNENGVRSFISNSFMNGSSHELSYEGQSYDYASGLMLAGRMSGVSPYHLATRIIQELGRHDPSNIISGSVSGYGGLYNYYNIQAYNSGGNTATVNGLIYAGRTDTTTLRPWNTRMKAIIGGGIFVGNQYVKRGQNTIYYEKFDVQNYWHQYMTNILAAVSESSISSSAYSDDLKSSSSIVFTIPVYRNMPDSVCERPVKNYGNVNNKLSSLSIDGYSITPTFNLYDNNYSLIVDNKVSSVSISGTLVDNLATVSGLGNHELNVGNNEIHINVTSQSGAVNTYTITVVRREAETSDNGTEFSTIYTINENSKTISNIAEGSSVEDVVNGCTVNQGTTVRILNADGSAASGKAATGNILTVYNSANQVSAQYTIILYGDVTGDGEIDLFDIVRIKRYMLKTYDVGGVYLGAADCNHDGNVDLFDIVGIKRNMLGKAYITQ